MVRVITILNALVGWGLGQALAPTLYPDDPHTWLFLQAFGASALAWLSYFLLAVGMRRSTS